MYKSMQIILTMKNTINSTVKYIMLQFKIAVFFGWPIAYIYAMGQPILYSGPPGKRFRLRM